MSEGLIGEVVDIVSNAAIKAIRSCVKHISEATITSLGYTPLSKRRGDRAGAWRSMIFPSNRVRIVIATKPVDFRKGHDGLAVLVKNELRKKPFTGTVFVFRVKRTDRLKLLYWDGTGLVMTHKRLEETTFTWPAIRDGLMSLNHAQFEALFAGLDWRKVKALAERPPTARE